LECKQVDVLVGTRCLRRQRCSWRKLWRIEDDEIELPTFIAMLPQRSEDVGLDPFRAGEPITLGIRAGECQSLPRAVDSQHGTSTSCKRIQGEAARIAEAVQHVTTGGELSHAQAVDTLIQIKACLVTLLQIDLELKGMLGDGDLRRFARAAK